MDEKQARLAATIIFAVAVGAWVGMVAALAREGARAIRQLGATAAAEVEKSGAKYRETVTLARYQAELDQELGD